MRVDAVAIAARPGAHISFRHTPHGMEDHECPICGHTMDRMQACHLHCNNCGAVLDCTDKGTFW